MNIHRHHPAALVAAAGFAAEGVCALAHRELSFRGAAYDHLLDAAYAVAMTGCACAVVLLSPALSPALSSSKPLRLAGYAAAAGFAAMGIESAVGAVHRVDALGPLFTIGIALAVLGSLAHAVVGAVSGRPRWAGAVPLVAMIAAAAGGEVGLSLLSAAAWLALTRPLSAGSASAQPTTRPASLSR